MKLIDERREGDKLIRKYDRDGKLYTSVETINEQESMTQQQYKDDCDVNLIIKKYIETGSVTHVRNAAEGVYADLTDLPSFEEAMKTVAEASAAFETVPAHIRLRFNNDPGQFISFLDNPENDEEAIKLNLKVRRQAPPPDPILTTLNQISQNTTPKPTSKSKIQT